MSLITSCPACGTMFRVVPDQLKISEGWVRCGHCSEVFDASKHLSDESVLVEPELAQQATRPTDLPTSPAEMLTRPAEIEEEKEPEEPPRPTPAQRGATESSDPSDFYGEDSHVLLVGSVSKTLAPGYRVGWLAGGRWHDQILRLKYSHTLACPTLPGMAVAEFLASGGYDRHLRRLRAALAANVERYRECIATEFPDGTRVSAPRGGFVLWVELPPGVDALQLHDQALRRRIVVAPGPLFSARQRFTNFIRISAGAPWSERIADGLRTLGRLAARE